MLPPLFTIGYEAAPQAAVLGELTAAGVDLLVDVRAVAASRRAGFSKRLLAAGVSELGISYIHLRGLGTPKEGRLAARAGRIADLVRIYADHLTTPQARAELADLIDLVRSGRRLCLLCYERHPEGCHRKLLAEAVMAETGIAVEHLLAPPIL